MQNGSSAVGCLHLIWCEQSMRSSVEHCKDLSSCVDAPCARVCYSLHAVMCERVSCLQLSSLQPAPPQCASVLPGMPDQALPSQRACLLSAGAILDRLAAYLVVVPLALLGRIPVPQFLAQTVLDLGSALYTWKLYSEDQARND